MLFLPALATALLDPRSLRPPQQYTDKFRERSLAPITLQPIGWVESPYKERFGTPRQPTVSTQVLEGDELEGDIVLAPGMGMEHTLRGLDGFERCWALTHMHLNTGWRPLVKPPRGPKRRHGVFATRSPHRPNQLALSALRIVSVDEAGLRVRVRGLDLLDGTPVLDLKPYVPYADAFPHASAGWVDALPDATPDGPDALGYWPPPAHLGATAAPGERSAAAPTSRRLGADADDRPADEDAGGSAGRRKGR